MVRWAVRSPVAVAAVGAPGVLGAGSRKVAGRSRTYATRAASGTVQTDRWSVAGRAQALGLVQIFQGLHPDELTPLAEVTQVEQYAPGSLIVRQDDPGDAVFLIAGGWVQVVARLDRDGVVTETELARLDPGETFGELSLLDGRTRSASCVAAEAVTCLRLGRDDFLAALERHWPLSQALLGVLAQRLRYADARLAEHARDPLTGLYNRRAMQEMFQRELARMQRQGKTPGAATSPLAVLFIDVDAFKAVNDRFGHSMGDEVLRSVALTLTGATRAADLVGRYGGDEFVLILPDSGDTGVSTVTARIRAALEQPPAHGIPVSLSIGATLVDTSQATDLDTVLRAADEAMYRDKLRRQ